MKAYVARLNSEQEHPHELVGIFVAHSHNGLCDLVDECCDIDCVEVTEVGPGGLFWSDRVNFHLPYRGEMDQMPGLPSGASLSELWLDVTRPEAEIEWQQLSWEKELA